MFKEVSEKRQPHVRSLGHVLFQKVYIRSETAWGGGVA